MSQKKTDPGIEVALPIVPMLDMSFQLLFFFIITFNPGKLDGQMTMNLPASGEAKAKDQSQVDPSKPPDVELEIPSDFVVAVKSYESNLTLVIRDSEKVYEVGKIDGLDRKTRDDQRVAVDELMGKLSAMLKEKLEEKKKDNPGKASDNVKIEANSAMRYSTLVSVMDACLKAGYQQVGFAPPPDAGQ
jgi:biopolymer transport protein ExbD